MNVMQWKEDFRVGIFGAGAIGAFIATCIFCIVWVSLIRIIGVTDSFGRYHNNNDGRKGLLSTGKSHGYDTY